MYKILKNIIEMDDYSVQKLSNQPPEPFEWNTVEGTELNVSDCIGGKGKIEVKGNTEQEQLSGKNLFNHYLYPRSVTQKGVTVTNNGDGSFTLNGTCTENNTVFNLGQTEDIKKYVNEGAVTHTAYYISGSCTKGQSSSTRTIIRLNYDTGTDKMIPLQDLSTQKVISKINPQDSRNDGWSWAFVLASGDSFNNFTIKYQVEKGTVGTDWEQYCGGQAAPNPSYEIPIKVVTGNNVIRHVGKNLLDLQNKTGEIIILRKLPKKLPAGTYVFSCDDIDKSISIRLSETNQTGTKSKAFHTQVVADGRRYVTGTINFDAEYINISSSSTAIENMQLEQGSIPTPYEQYKEKDYKLDLWKENEFDKNNVNKLNAYIDSSNKITSSEATRTLYVECKKNTLYKISKAKSARFRVMYTTDIPAINRVGNGYIVNDTGEEIIIKTGNNAKYLCVFYYHANQDTLTEQAILESIQIQEAIELCKIDNYKDVLFKNVAGDENYNAELENGAWYKKKVIDKKFLDGEMYFANSGVTNVFYTPVITNYSRINNKPFCDNFKGFNNVDTASSVNIINSVGFNNTYNYNRLYISFNGTIDELTDFLNERKPTLYYANDNPVYEKITDPTLISQLEALNKAKWFKGVNHWWTETDNLEPNLKGTYRQAINE